MIVLLGFMLVIYGIIVMKNNTLFGTIMIIIGGGLLAAIANVCY